MGRGTRLGVAVIVSVVLGAPTVQAAFPGDNGRIAFSRLDRNGKLVTVDKDGSAREVIYRTRLAYAPAFSADGKWIAFNDADTLQAGHQRVAIIASDGSGHRRLTRRGWSFPSWTWFGRVLATCAGPPCPRKPAIYSIDPFERSDKTRIGGTFEGDHPAGHPSKLRLAYVATRQGQRDIFVKPLRRCCARRLTDSNAVESFPDWAPRGHWIVFVRQPHGRPQAAHDLFVVNVADGTTRRLTRTAADEMLPRFSPDGRFIVFSKSWGEGEDHRSFVFRMRRGGKHVQKVGRRNGDHGPSWQPIIP